MIRFFSLLLTLALLVVPGAGALWASDTGHWWLVVVGVGALLYSLYRVSTPEERAGYTRFRT